MFAPLPLFHPGVRRFRNLSYGDAGRRNRLDLYRRRRGGSGGPVLIHLHGGGFSLAPGRKSFYARRLLFRLASKLDVPVQERLLRRDELPEVAELFLSGTTTEVLPVVRVDGKAVGDGRPGPVTTRLQEAYAQAVREFLAEK